MTGCISSETRQMDNECLVRLTYFGETLKGFYYLNYFMIWNVKFNQEIWSRFYDIGKLYESLKAKHDSPVSKVKRVGKTNKLTKHNNISKNTCLNVEALEE